MPVRAVPSVMRYAAVALFAALLPLASCRPHTGGTGPSSVLEGSSSVCAPGFVVPAAYSIVDTRTMPGPSPTKWHPATTTTLLEGPDDRRLVAQSGTIGDFADERATDRLPLPDGGHGALYALGNGAWGFYWTQEGPCNQQSLSAGPMSRAAFLSLLVEAGVVAPGDGSGVVVGHGAGGGR